MCSIAFIEPLREKLNESCFCSGFLEAGLSGRNGITIRKLTVGVFIGGFKSPSLHTGRFGTTYEFQTSIGVI